MSITSSRTVQIQFSGDVESAVIQSALDNEASLAEIEILTLASGNNTITATVVDGLVATGLTIIPPSGNTIPITLKGVNGDTGVELHLTDPTSIGLGADFTSLVLNVSDDVVGVRLIWS